MDTSTHIEDEKIWKSYNLASQVTLKSSAPDCVDEWKFVDANEEVELRSRPVSQEDHLKHCPTDYTEWQFGWNHVDVKVECSKEITNSEATSVYLNTYVLRDHT